MQAERLSRVLDGEIASTIRSFSAALAREGFRVVQSLDLADVVGKTVRRDARPLVVLSVIEPGITGLVTAQAPARAPDTVFAFTVRELGGHRVAIDGPDDEALRRIAQCGRVDEKSLVQRIGRAIRVH